MKLLKSIFYLLIPVLLLSATSCQKDKYPELGDGLFAEIVTSKGTMVAKLTPNRTPATVANFVALAEGVHPMVTENFKGKKFYNGLIFHRVMDNFMIQGGCPQGTGRGTPGYRFGDEFDDSLRHDKAGVLSMANSGPGGTNGSQFFILDDVPKPHLDDVHSVFGQIVLGDEVRDSISRVKVGPQNKPIEDVVIQEVNIIRQGFDARKFDAVQVWNTELPKLDERRKKFEEKKRLEAEEARRKAAEMSEKAAKEVVGQLTDYKSKSSTTDSGLMYYQIGEGDGDKPKQGETVTVSYEGYFNDGKLFGSSSKELEQKFGIYSMNKEKRGFYGDLKMTMSPDMNMIPGFKEGVSMMSVGDKYFFYLPSHLAYGEQGAPPAIPPNTDIVYIIEMLAKVE